MTDDINAFKATHAVTNANGLVGFLIGVGVVIVFLIVVFALAFALTLARG